MKLKLYCPKCYAGSPYIQIPAMDYKCKKCSTIMPINVSESIISKNIIDVCCSCNCGTFYTERASNRKFGCLVISSAIVAYIWLSTIVGQWALFALLSAAVVDFTIYSLTTIRTVCYRCLSEYVGAEINPEHKPFDNNTAARYAEKL